MRCLKYEWSWKGSIIAKKNYNPETHKKCYSYVVRYNEAIKLIEAVYPYLVILSKKQRAELIINEYKSLTPRNGRYSKELLILKEEFYDKFISLR